VGEALRERTARASRRELLDLLESIPERRVGKRVLDPWNT
jgi:hypothetical protein